MSVSCKSHDCAHNTQGKCYAKSISVHGRSAHTTHNTFCSSFVDASYAADVEFATEFSVELLENKKALNTGQIKCHAGYCKHNANNLCKAEKVEINHTDASCETFVQ
ncbi:MAG TPA: hypothetical protein DCY20_00320 [Firmicutes bacterium]|nr:hypothetical protein [Bacillota bacterium]